MTLLKNKKIKLIYSEVEFMVLYENQPLFHDITAFLSQYEYQLFSIFNLRRDEKGALHTADAIYLAPALY